MRHSMDATPARRSPKPCYSLCVPHSYSSRFPPCPSIRSKEGGQCTQEVYTLTGGEGGRGVACGSGRATALTLRMASRQARESRREQESGGGMREGESGRQGRSPGREASPPDLPPDSGVARHVPCSLT